MVAVVGGGAIRIRIGLGQRLGQPVGLQRGEASLVVLRAGPVALVAAVENVQLNQFAQQSRIKVGVRAGEKVIQVGPATAAPVGLKAVARFIETACQVELSGGVH